MIRCHKSNQQTDTGTPHSEASFQQSCFYASLLKLLFGMGAPAPSLYIDSPHMPQNTPKMKRLRGGVLQYIDNILIVTIRKLHLM